jgi:hypothetical protein
MFERATADVRRRFSQAGLRHVFETVRRISPVTEESFHDSRTLFIGLNSADVGKPYAAFHTRSYLLVHELGHHFAETRLTRAGRGMLAPLFGDYDAPYRRTPKPAIADADHVSRYSMTHPAEDFAETFAVVLWRLWDRRGVETLLRGKSARCRRKVAEMEALLRRDGLRRADVAGHVTIRPSLVERASVRKIGGSV